MSYGVCNSTTVCARAIVASAERLLVALITLGPEPIYLVLAWRKPFIHVDAIKLNGSQYGQYEYC